MDIKIVADSCCDLSEEIKKKTNIDIVPLTMRIGEKEYVDDDTLDKQDYIKAMKESRTAPSTSCPAVYDFMEKFREAKNIFVVTISSKLSGTYNSAMQAKQAILEEAGDRFIHVFDSMSACIGETLVSLKIHEHIKNNLKNLEIVDRVNSYIKEMKTFFVLENMDNLVKSGRLNPLVAKAAGILNIKPIMGSDNGNIRLVDKVRGYERALKRLVEVIGEEGSRLEEKVLGIAHCNCLQRALDFKNRIMERYNFKDIIIVGMSGISSTYANDGGLVIAF